MLGNIEGGEGANRGWDGWMASLTQQTWVWASFGRWWRTGKPGMLQSMGSQKSWTHLSNWTTTIEHSRISFRGNIEVSAPVLFLRLFWYGPFFKVFIEFVTILLLFYVLAFGCEACGVLVSQAGIEPTLPALEGKVLTTGPPGKSPCKHLCLGAVLLTQ